MMKLPRREFLTATVGTLAASHPLCAQLTTVQFFRATHEDFSKFVGGVFHLRDANGAQRTVTLLSASEGKHPMPRGLRTPISLLFRGSDQSLKQDVYEVSHAALGTAKLLVVPVDPTGETVEVILG